MFYKIVLIASFVQLTCCLQLSNTTDRKKLIINTINTNNFLPCFRQVCFDNLGCFEPYFIAAYLSTPPLSVCPQPPEEMGVRFLVLTKPIYDRFESINTIEANSSVSFVIHGILSEYDSYFQLMTSYLLLQKYSDHVIAVDWSVPANPPILSSMPLPGISFFLTHANVEVVGRMVCNLIQSLVQHRNIETKNVRILGFSAGGNMIAFTGDYCAKRYNLVPGHCVAIEMSGFPYHFTNKPLPMRGHCQVIDCIHSTYNPRVVLLTEILGITSRFATTQANCDTDYFINYPMAIVEQPGCFPVYFCSHFFALLTYSSALMRCSYQTYQCELLSIVTGLKKTSQSVNTTFDSNIHGPLGEVCIKTSPKPLLTC